MRHLILAFVLFVSAAAAQAQCRSADYRDFLSPDQSALLAQSTARIPYATGNHWIATKGTRRLHIIGTMHSGDRRMGAVVRRLRPIIVGADALLLEVAGNKAEEAFEDFELFKNFMLLPEGQSLSSMMSDSSWYDLTARLSPHGMDPRALDRLQPWYASELLDQTACVSRRPSIASQGLDDRIEAVAIRARVPIGSLETVEQSFGSILKMPKRDHIRFMELELARQKTGRRTTNDLDNAYFEEAIGDILVMSRWALYTDYDAPRAELDRLYDSLTRALLTRRNRNWMPVLLNTAGETIVVAVGAAHLPGKEGILNLLKARGYSLERAEF